MFGTELQMPLNLAKHVQASFKNNNFKGLINKDIKGILTFNTKTVF